MVTAPPQAPADAAPAHRLPPLGRPGRARARFEWAAWLAAGLLLTVVLSWPLVRDLSTVVPQDVGDPLGQAWFLAWGGHALAEAPWGLLTGSVFDGNAFAPEPRSAAFSDSLLGWAPFALVGEGVTAAVVRYNVVWLVAGALAFAAAALLARELGCRPGAAAVAGAAYSFAPWKLTHGGHLNVLSTGPLVLALFLLVSGYRRGRPWQVVAGWAAAAWQLSLGFALGIWSAYLLLALGVLCLVSWLRAGRPGLPRRLLVATGAGGALLLAVTALMVRPYLAIVAADPSAIRGREEVALYSPPVRALLAAPGESRLWGQATAFVRDTLPWAPEMALFPGLTVLVLALAGLRWRGATRGLRVGLCVGTGLLVLLSLGLALLDGLLYDPLLSYAPGWEGLRTPGRLAFLWTLGLALLAAFGAERAAGGVRRLAAGRGLPLAGAATATGLLLAGLVAYEGAPRLPLAAVPQPPAALAGLPGPLLHLPSDAVQDTRYMLWSTDGFVPVVNGSASYTPPALTEVRAATATFPDAGSVAFLRDRGVRTVVVHRATAAGTAWAAAADAPVDGLGIERTDAGDVVVFRL